MTSRCWPTGRCITSASRCFWSWPTAIWRRARPRGWRRSTTTRLPALLTIDDALAADSRFEDGPRIWTKGDPAAAIAAAPHVIEGEIEIGGQEHFYLEGQVALALPQEGGDMIVHSSSQHPTEVQHKVAEALGVPMNAVRVEVRRMGGGFGGKESQGNALAVACAVAARATGRPCRMRYDRDDDFVITGKRHDFRIRYRVGVDDDGRIQGIEFRQYARCGWAQDLSLPVADRAMLHADNAYHLPACPDRKPPAAHQHPERHRLSRLRRPAGHGRDRAGDGPHRPCAGPRPAGGAAENFYARRRAAPDHPLRDGGARFHR
jgi:xanthine dehydrogenase molybdopterin-binding subunit B